eukprot:55708-Chlamydomonas_euryale.AAC.1
MQTAAQGRTVSTAVSTAVSQQARWHPSPLQRVALLGGDGALAPDRCAAKLKPQPHAVQPHPSASGEHSTATLPWHLAGRADQLAGLWPDAPSPDTHIPSSTPPRPALCYSASGSRWMGRPLLFLSMMSRASGTWRPSTSALTVPRPPAPRAVRPTRRTYSDGSRGKSNSTTCWQCMLSMPRDMRSVHTSTSGGEPGLPTRRNSSSAADRRSGRTASWYASTCSHNVWS